MSWNGTKTWNVGDAATSADMNAYVRDNIAYLYGDNPPVALTPSAPWANLGAPYGGVSIERHGLVVQLNGVLATSSAIAAGHAIVTAIPAGYIPASQHVLTACLSGAYARMDATTAGALILTPAAGAGGYLSINASYSLIS